MLLVVKETFSIRYPTHQRLFRLFPDGGFDIATRFKSAKLHSEGRAMRAEDVRGYLIVGQTFYYPLPFTYVDNNGRFDTIDTSLWKSELSVPARQCWCAYLQFNDAHMATRPALRDPDVDNYVLHLEWESLDAAQK